MTTCIHRHVPSPVGPLLLTAGDRGLTGIGFADGSRPAAPPAGSTAGNHPHLDRAERELGEYFAGARRKFTVPLAPAGTDFQLEVWAALRTVPWGTTVSYADIAARIGRPAAFRAVGLANGRNPLPIVVPCHRVIGASGSLTGYGGGLERKRRLLELEGVALRLS